MRSRVLPLIGAGAVALAVAATYSLPAGASGTHVSLSHASSSVSHAAKPLGAACKGAAQQDNDNGVGIVSQDFTDSGFDIYDSQGADDFKLKKPCAAAHVIVDALYFNGSGPCDNFTVTFYKDNGSSAPGTVIKTAKKSKYTATATGMDIKLKKAVKLAKGLNWVSVQCVMAFAAGGEFGWNTNNTVRNDGAMWQNPGNGFSTGCTSYNTLTTCIAASEGGDFSFSVTK